MSQNEKSELKSSQMDAYRQDVCSRANEMLQKTIPEKLSTLDQLLQTERLQLDYCDEAREFAISSLKEYEDALKELQKEEEEENEEETQNEDSDGDGPSPSKKSKSQQSTSCNSTSKASLAKKSRTSVCDPPPKIPVNEKVLELITILKPELIQLSSSCQLLKDWITIHVPKHEDGNNFGVEVQEEALQELTAVRDEANQTMEEQSAYHLARANILEKITQESNIEDLKVFIYDEDEKQCRRLRNITMSLRTNYTSILDLITKNYERIIHPRGFNTGAASIMY